MHGGEGGGRKVVDLLEHGSDNVREVGSGIVLTRVEPLDVTAGAKAFALTAQDERAGAKLCRFIEGAGELGKVLLREGVQGLRVVEYELDDSGFGVVVQVDHVCFS